MKQAHRAQAAASAPADCAPPEPTPRASSSAPAPNFVVGPTQTLTNGTLYVQAAAAKQKAGDYSMWQDVLVKVDAGKYNRPIEYLNDCWQLPKWVRNFTLDGTGSGGAKARIINQLDRGMPTVKGTPFVGSASDKGLIWDAGRDVTIRGFEIEGARTSSGANNGAGLRLDGGTNLTLEAMIFRHCQNGLLLSAKDDPLTVGEDESGNIVILNSEFSCCGFGGQSHLLYCSTANLLQVEDSVFTMALGEGNTFKTRADVTTLRHSTLTTGSGVNSWIYDSMGGTNNLEWNTFQNLPGFSSQPRNCLHIYIEPQSMPVYINIQNNVFDCRGRTIGHPLLVDPRVLYNGTGGIGEDGLWHKRGENYYVPGEFRPMTGIVDNNIILINADQRNHFGYDPVTRTNRMIWTPNDQTYGPIPLPPGLEEGDNNIFIVADDPAAPKTPPDCDRHHHEHDRDRV